MVERHLAKVNVASSNLVFRSIFYDLGKLVLSLSIFFKFRYTAVSFIFTQTTQTIDKLFVF